MTLIPMSLSIGGIVLFDRQDNEEDLFPVANYILEDLSLIEADHVPEKIVSRDQEKKIVAHHLKPILLRGKPNHIYISGSSGVGKTIVTKYVVKKLKETARERDKDIYVELVTVNCKGRITLNTSSVCYQILKQLTKTEPKQTRRPDYYLTEIWNTINERAKLYGYYIVVLFIDEIDYLPDRDANNLLYTFTRAISSEDITANNARLAVILATNERKYVEDHLGTDVISSGNIKPIEFPDYNTRDLFHILKSREMAFKEGAVSDELLISCAKLVAEKYHGDARYAIDLMYQAALIAIDREAHEITQEHLNYAENKVNSINTLESLQKLSLHDRLLILSAHLIYDVILEYKIEAPILTGTVTETYNHICEIIDTQPNVMNYVSSRYSVLSKKKYLHVKKEKGYANNRVVYLYPEIRSFINELIDEDIKSKITESYLDIQGKIEVLLSNINVKKESDGSISHMVKYKNIIASSNELF